MTYPSNGGGVAQDQLRSIVERIERLREEIGDLNKDVSEVYKEARGNGFDVPTLKALVSERAKAAKDPAAYQEREALLDLYRHAVGTGTNNAPRVHAREAATQPTDNPNPATSSPPETGGDAASSSLASSPTNSPAARPSAGEGTHPTDDQERGDAVRGKGSPDGEHSRTVKSPHGAHESDDFDPVRDMPAHLRR